MQPSGVLKYRSNHEIGMVSKNGVTKNGGSKNDGCKNVTSTFGITKHHKKCRQVSELAGRDSFVHTSKNLSKPVKFRYASIGIPVKTVKIVSNYFQSLKSWSGTENRWLPKMEGRKMMVGKSMHQKPMSCFGPPIKSDTYPFWTLPLEPPQKG